jgi:putative salt-induced outer membrane protein
MTAAHTRWPLVALALTYPDIALAQEVVTSGGAGDAESVASIRTLDPGIRRMIETAIEGGNEATIASVLAVARLAAPESTSEIEAHEQGWRTQLAANKARAEEERLAKLRTAGVLENWKGEAELGFTRATGNAPTSGLFGSISLKRQGEAWTHQLSARADVQRVNGATTTERLFAAWQPNYRFEEQAYAYGLTQYERDPFAGYESRVTLGGGLGYRPLSGKRLTLEIEGGPAFRRVEGTDGIDLARIAARGSLDLAWRITPTLSFTQKAALFIEEGDGNIIANTALDTKLIGNLKARFSYRVQYERNPPIGTVELNTQTRATFVYGF